jgi:hypothetical protein
MRRLVVLLVLFGTLAIIALPPPQGIDYSVPGFIANSFCVDGHDYGGCNPDGDAQR